jgi:hypothetical protein
MVDANPTPEDAKRAEMFEDLKEQYAAVAE